MFKKNLDATATLGLLPRVYSFINLILYMKPSIKKRNQPCCCGVFPALGSSRKQKDKERVIDTAATPRKASNGSPRPLPGISHSLNTLAQAHG